MFIIDDIVTVILWIGMWGVVDIMIRSSAGDDYKLQFASYFALILLGVLLTWILYF